MEFVRVNVVKGRTYYEFSKDGNLVVVSQGFVEGLGNAIAKYNLKDGIGYEYDQPVVDIINGLAHWRWAVNGVGRIAAALSYIDTSEVA